MSTPTTAVFLVQRSVQAAELAPQLFFHILLLAPCTNLESFCHHHTHMASPAGAAAAAASGMAGTGVKMPRMMYGTAWKKERTTALVEQAVLAGFRGERRRC